MTIPPYARLAAKLLKREAIELEPPAAAVRADAIAGIERALVRRASGRVRRRLAYATSAAAAAGLLAWLSAGMGSEPERARTRTPSHAIMVHAFGAGAQVFGADANGALEHPGGRVQVLPNGRALLAFGNGTRVTLEGDGDLTLVENGASQVLALDHGALRADVAKLAKGERFLVHTADAEVEVHGTSFRVSARSDRARCNGASLTEVFVFEGVVSVRSAGVEQRLEKGAHWAASCPGREPALATNAAPPAPALEPQRDAAPLHPSRTREPSPRPALPASSDLIAQNDAFAAAVAAFHAGDLARAERGFDDLLARFPGGPLEESAAVQRLKVVRASDRRRAQTLARDYLARYPAGFARELAAEIALESP